MERRETFRKLRMKENFSKAFEGYFQWIIRAGDHTFFAVPERNREKREKQQLEQKTFSLSSSDRGASSSCDDVLDEMNTSLLPPLAVLLLLLPVLSF